VTPELNTDVPHSARIYDYLLGGKEPPGSVLAISTVTADSAPDEVNKGVAAYVARGIQEKARDRAEVEQLFRGFELIDPGVALVNRWRPDDAARAYPDEHVHMYGGIARKP
jgi:hypothetical protein